MLKAAREALLSTVYGRYWPVVVGEHVGLVRII